MHIYRYLLYWDTEHQRKQVSDYSVALNTCTCIWITFQYMKKKNTTKQQQQKKTYKKKKKTPNPPIHNLCKVLYLQGSILNSQE